MSETRAADALQRIREEFHYRVKDLPPAAYREVCEELLADMTGNLEALAEEEANA